MLKGIKVLDLSNLLPGPFCTLFLADLGAEVIKVESLNGDPMRRFEAVKQNIPSPYFLALNRNKRGIALNLKSKEGKEIFMKLAKNADVIIEGFRPGKLDALGIGFNDAKKINPDIVYCSITGYGQKGSYKNKAGHDLNYAALGGMLDAISSKPFVPGIQTADVGSGLIAAFSIVSALLHREKSGRGCCIDVPVLDGVLSVIGMHIAYSSVSENKKTLLSGSKVCYNVYETKDRKFVSLGAVEHKFWNAFCNAVKRKDLVLKQFESNAKTMEGMRDLFKTRTMKEWLRLNEKHDFCCEPVKKINQVINENYFKQRKMFVNLDGITQVAIPAVFSSFKKGSYSSAPKLGEHTAEILESIGYNKKQIKELRIHGVIL